MPASATEPSVRASFAEQAGWCDKLGSPFTALLCRTLGETLDRTTAAGRRVLEWPGDPAPSADALALRLCGGLHGLVRAGVVPQLAALYPPHPTPREAALAAALRPVLDRADLMPWLDSAPQTNEVGRSAVLMAGLLAAAEALQRPLHLLELGASAGLNLILDRYGYDLGGRRAGDPASPLRLRPEWKGPPPPVADVVVAGRRGVDLRPANDPDRLLAYIWPDQEERLAQAERAIALRAADPPPVDAGDAGDWIIMQLDRPAAEGTARIIMHSVAYQYFPEATQARVAAAIEAAGEREPLGWLRMEKVPGDERYSLRLRLWPRGEDRLLAWTHPHGRSVSWLLPPAR
ncbi:MAG: hypothetical protein QOH04_1940 [Sphingomonadales bacterium]|nr:hypothetical protein [Sphingomonadales bacterium]